jgi:predicted ATPase
VHVRSRLSAFAGAVHWLTAVRAPVPRRSPPQRGVRLGPAGESVEKILAEDWLRDRSLKKRIDPSYRIMFQHELGIEETAEGASVVLVPVEGAPISTALADTGEGASQALPVFVLGALAETGQLGPSPLLVLEQPEMHLHPAAERELASFLCRVAKVEAARLLIETHSENLLLFVQLAIAKGELAPSDVAVYFIRPLRGGGGSVADRVEIDDLGRPKGWPPGVFSEDVEMARELFLAQRRRASAP